MPRPGILRSKSFVFVYSLHVQSFDIFCSRPETIVICKSDVIKHMLLAPILKGRMGKWMFALSEFDIRYQPAKAVKGQALADLIADRVNTDMLGPCFSTDRRVMMGAAREFFWYRLEG